MARKEKRILTEKEINMIEGWSAIRLPILDMASLLHMAESDLQMQINKRPELRQALLEGRAKAKVRTHRTLFEMGHGTKGGKDPLTGEVIKAVEPEFQALKFWCQTQEHMRTTDKLELSGPGGGPIENANVTKEELKARVMAMRRANDLTEDE